MVRRLLLSLVFALSLGTACAQDKIVKVNGDTIPGKVLEISASSVSYKKANVPNGPTYTDRTTEIALIIFSNGKTEYFAKSQDQDKSNQTQAAPDSSSKQNQKNRIEFMNGIYTINGRAATQKDVNNMLSKSKNPAVTLPLKAARATKTTQTIIKIVSFPTTIGGGVTSLVTGVNFINDIRRGRDRTSTYVNFFSSFLATISLPITSKILKKKSEKMYGKLIDAYNVTN